MILNKFSLNGKMHPHFNFETLYIKFQEEFFKICIFWKVSIKVEKYDILFYIETVWPISSDIVYVALENWLTFKKKSLTLLKEENTSNFKLEDGHIKLKLIFMIITFVLN